jgi:hypothetical protein
VQGRRLAAEHNAAALTLYISVTPEAALARNGLRPPGARLPDKVMANMCKVNRLTSATWHESSTVARVKLGL